MIDTAAYIQRLEESNPLREPTLRSVVHSLELPPGSTGLDVGCGIGLQELLLAEAVGPRGHVTGVDLVPEFLRCARETVSRRGLAERISFREGDMNHLPFEDRTFDWVWSADCVGYPAADLVPLLKEIARVVKPGGTVAILAWSSQQLLPGYLMLEARLNATCSAFAPYLQDVKPESHFARALGRFDAAGLVECAARTYVGEVQAPLDKSIRRALVLLFEMLWGERQPKGSLEDWTEYQRLCLPESDDFILNLPDYYAFFTYSVFRGKVPVSGLG